MRSVDSVQKAEGSRELPKGWVEAPITKIAHIVYGKGLPQNKLIENGDYPVFGANSIIGYYNEYLHEKPQILISCRGANSGVINISPPQCYVTSNSLVVALPEIYYECFKFLYYSLKSSDKKSIVTGTAQPQVTIDNLDGFLIPLPPLNEQKRIVAKLDAVMPRIEAVKERLNKIPGILKRFRQSVLTAAVTGRLTEEWREKHPEVDEWEEKLLGDIILEGPQNGLYKPQDFYGDGVLILRIDNFYNGLINPWDTLKRLQVTNTEKNTYLLKNGDIVINRVNSMQFLGKSAMVRNLNEICVFESNMMRIRLNENIVNFEYITRYLNCQEGLSELRKNAKHAVNQSSINQQDIKAVVCPLPPLEEQKEIVRQVDRLFALADKVEDHYQKAKARVDKLSQSVLAKAFRGELVPQDPNDEPAEKLLERILEENARMEADRKPAKAKKAGAKGASKKTKAKKSAKKRSLK